MTMVVIGAGLYVGMPKKPKLYEYCHFCQDSLTGNAAITESEVVKFGEYDKYDKKTLFVQRTRCKLCKRFRWQFPKGYEKK